MSKTSLKSHTVLCSITLFQGAILTTMLATKTFSSKACFLVFVGYFYSFIEISSDTVALE